MKKKQIKRWGYGGFVGCHHWNHCSTKRELVLVNHFTDCSSSKKLQEHTYRGGSWLARKLVSYSTPRPKPRQHVFPASYFFSIKSGDNHKDHHSFCSASYSNNVSLALIWEDVIGPNLYGEAAELNVP
ncbi:hypothetical protein D5086_014535 [Populus alba]|uniref:Uncharacterized protein n=1 Tax=Populus alba TaxID=43335 RepID=A0ACC4BY96_POPAL